MKRSAIHRKFPITRTPMKRRSRSLSAADKQAYATATDRAEAIDGFHIVCEGCGMGLVKGREERHHTEGRHAGTTRADLIEVLCGRCHHEGRHGIRQEVSRDT